MTEHEAIDAARKFVAHELLEATGLHSVQRFTASQLPEHLRNRNDFWIVRFNRDRFEDVVESPSHILVEVDDVSGQARSVDSL